MRIVFKELWVVTVSDGNAVFAAYIVRMPELVIDQVKLPSRPLAGATGLVPDAGVAYIAEQHPEGRITFIDLETGVPSRSALPMA